MTGGHASKQHLTSLSPSLRELYFPSSTKPENFTAGKMVKGRNEPCAIGGVAWVVYKLHGTSLESLTETAFRNTVELFALELDEESRIL
jgi:TatD DNase family protein